MKHTEQQNGSQTQYLLDTAHISGAQIESVIEEPRLKSKGQRWCCAVCGTYVTDDGQLTHINGTHQHYKVNPQGQGFQFCSFKYAEGCSRSGELTAEHTWYSGYLWQFAHCNRCDTQLGWYFAGPKSFYGLIKRQIVMCPKEKPQ